MRKQLKREPILAALATAAIVLAEVQDAVSNSPAKVSLSALVVAVAWRLARRFTTPVSE